MYRTEYRIINGIREKVYVHSNHPKVKSQVEVKEKKKDTDDYRFFSNLIWEIVTRKSELSGAALPRYDINDKEYMKNIRYHQHHVFPKSKFKELKYEPHWILMVTREEHDIIEHGSTTQKEKIGIFKKIESIQDKVLYSLPESKLKDRMLNYLERILGNYRAEKLQTV